MQAVGAAGHANGGAPHSRPGAVAALLAGLASRLSSAFAAGDLPPQLAADLAHAFSGAVSVSVAVPLDGQDGAMLAFSGAVHETAAATAAAAEAPAAGASGLALLPMAASAAGRCMETTGVVHAFAPAAGGDEQLADVLQHQQQHAAASLLLLPVPGLQPQQQGAAGAAAGASSGGAALATAPQPFRAAGVFAIGLGPAEAARRTLVARAAYIAMALSRTLDLDVAGLRQQAAASAAAGAAAAGTVAIPFHPEPAAEGSAQAAAAAEAATAAAAAEQASPAVSSEDLDGSDTERGTEAAVAPYMARLSPTPPPLLQPLAGAVGGAAAASAAGQEPSSPVNRSRTRQQAQRQQQQQQEAVQQRQQTQQEPEQHAEQPATAVAAEAAVAEAAEPQTSPQVKDVNAELLSSPSGKPLMPWSKATATATAAEQQMYETGAMSAATLRFASPQLEAEFAREHAAFLTKWVDTPALLLAVLYLMLRLAAPQLFAGARLGPLLLPVVATAAMALLRIFDPASYLRRREWLVAAARLAWLLHFAGALAPQGGTPAAAAAVVASPPSSFRDLALLMHLACADALLVLSLLLPVRLQSMLMLGSAASALVIARAPLRACVTGSSGPPQARCVLQLLGASLVLGTLLPAAIIYLLERSARCRWLQRRTLTA